MNINAKEVYKTSVNSFGKYVENIFPISFYSSPYSEKGTVIKKHLNIKS